MPDSTNNRTETGVRTMACCGSKKTEKKETEKKQTRETEKKQTCKPKKSCG